MKKLIILFYLFTFNIANSENLLDTNLLKKLTTYTVKKGIPSLKLDSNLFFEEVVIKKYLTRTSIKDYKRKTKLTLIRIKITDTSNFWLINAKDIDKRKNSFLDNISQNSIYPIAGDSTIYIREFDKIIKYIRKGKFTPNSFLKDSIKQPNKTDLITIIRNDFNRVRVKNYSYIFYLLTI